MWDFSFNASVCVSARRCVCVCLQHVSIHCMRQNPSRTASSELSHRHSYIDPTFISESCLVLFLEVLVELVRFCEYSFSLG